uniref:MFS domain-containing protein n=1 Tax=Caenorhabditis tropicalis TaxID=1561998 RepID=A0A1I7TRV6_9PELO
MKEEESIRLDLNPVGSENENCKRKNGSEVFKLFEPRKTLSDDFGFYEKCLLFLTQAGYIPIAAAMLMTAFMEPSPEWCDTIKESDSAWQFNEHREFYSLSVESGFDCQPNSSQTTAMMSSLLMWGALVGSFVCGFLSDKFGRKPVFLGCLSMVTAGHIALSFSNNFSWLTINGVLASMGFFCGGYMVTNFVILTEAFELARSRLLVVSLNGWSISMAATGIIASLTPYWFTYHVIFAVIGSILTIVSYKMCSESCRWLSANGSHQEAKRVAFQITLCNDKREIDEDDIIILKWYEVLGFSAPTHTEEKKTWKTLFKSTRFLKPTAVMCYSFMASSIVSFGFYFSIDILPGNRYYNMALMGILKFILGFTPFFLNRFITKRIIAISSIGVCCLAAVLILPIQYYEIQCLRTVIILLSLVISAGIDPTWKINHLYSAELFPTSVRSMARGVCNAGGRLGSVMAPMIVYLRTLNLLIPNVVFAVLLFVQLVVIVMFLPDDSDKDANEMNDE